MQRIVAIVPGRGAIAKILPWASPVYGFAALVVCDPSLRLQDLLPGYLCRPLVTGAIANVGGRCSEGLHDFGDILIE